MKPGYRYIDYIGNGTMLHPNQKFNITDLLCETTMLKFSPFLKYTSTHHHHTLCRLGGITIYRLPRKG